MPTIARLNQAYSTVNLVGHLQDTKLGMQANVTEVVNRAIRARHLQGFAAVRNRAALNMHFMLAAFQTGDRIMTPFTALNVAARYQQGLRLAGPSMYPLAELAFGRGQELPERVIPNFFARLSYLYDCASHHGVLGSLFEHMPRGLAARAEQAGWITTAKACHVGAIMGRTALQVPRALICAWALVENTICSAAVVALIALMERVATGIKYGVDKVSPLHGQQPGVARSLLEDSVSKLRSPFFAVAADHMVVDNLEEVADHAGPGMNQRVTTRVNAALNRFANVDDTVDGGRLVRETADQIVADLRRFCANAPDDTAFRGGVALLRDFIELTFDEVNWVAPEPV